MFGWLKVVRRKAVIFTAVKSLRRMERNRFGRISEKESGACVPGCLGSAWGLMKSGTKPHALLSTTRIANVPSVVSNLGVGVLLGSIDGGADFSWPWLLSLAAVLFYVSGNFLNDWADRDWDRSCRCKRRI